MHLLPYLHSPIYTEASVQQYTVSFWTAIKREPPGLLKISAKALYGGGELLPEKGVSCLRNAGLHPPIVARRGVGESGKHLRFSRASTSF